MPRSKSKIKRINPNPEALKAAADKVLNHSFSIRRAALEYNISKSTLSRHLKIYRDGGHAEFVYAPSNAVKQVFSDAQEMELNSYLQQCANMHYGLSTGDVRKLAYSYATANEINHPGSWDIKQQAGIDWLKFFLKRNKDISLRKPQATSLARSTAFNKVNVNIFFDKLYDVLERYNFGPENIYNLDESGLSTVHVPVRIIAPKGKKQVGGMTSGERGLNITIICAINAMGNSIPPGFVFPRVHYKQHMLKGAPTGSMGMANPSGWSNSKIFLEYLRHFVKFARSSEETKTLLILDNHDSHISIEILTFAKAHGIVMLTLPPHTSHKLQPLDRTVFGPLKKYYNTACNEWLLSNSGKPMTLYDVAECAGKAYPKTFSPENILSGFRVTGIFPLNRNVFGEHEYLSSFVTDRPLEPIVDVASGGEGSIIQTSPPDDEDNSLTDLNQPIRTTSSEITHITPDKIRPFPKAQARKGNCRGGRKLGRCRILTDTPEKNEVEEADAIRKRKLAVKNKPILKKIAVPSSSSSSEEELSYSDDSLEDVDLETQEIEDEICNGEIKVGGFVLVKLETKKSRNFFVAKVVEVISSEQFGVTYFKKVTGGKFVLHSESVYEISMSDIVMTLPPPNVAGGTERTSEFMYFSVDFSTYNVQ